MLTGAERCRTDLPFEDAWYQWRDAFGVAPSLDDTALHFIAGGHSRGWPANPACAYLTRGNFSDVPPLEASEFEFIRAWLA